MSVNFNYVFYFYENGLKSVQIPKIAMSCINFRIASIC